jgi:uncharacterized protein
MKIGILSDTHNHADNTRAALAELHRRGITRLVHCGDITTPEIVHLFAGWDVTFVWGNMDDNWAELSDAARLIGVPIPKMSHEIQIDGKLIGITHGADQNMLYGMMMSGKYVYVCHGHTHERRDEVRSAYGVRLINPGALGGSRPQARSVCILDPASNEVEFITFPEMT